MRVRVYRNLHKNCYSVQRKVNGRWKLWQHVDTISLSNVKFIVQKGGHARVLREKRKNVHAFVEGDVAYFKRIKGVELHYNPYLASYFFQKFPGTELYVHEVREANKALLNKNGVVAL